MSHKVEDRNYFFKNWLKFQWWLLYHDGYFYQKEILDNLEKQFKRMRIWMKYLPGEAPMDSEISSEENEMYPVGCPCTYHTNRKEITHYSDRFWDADETPDSFHHSYNSDPPVDVIDNDKTVSITVELPGSSEKDIELNIVENKVIIKVNNEKNKFYKEIKLSYKVDAKSAKISYNNGVLDIEFRKINH